MIRRCVERSIPFGVVLIREGREAGSAELSLAAVGTMASVRTMTLNGDGTFDIVSVGTRRFELLAVDAEREPYLVGEVRELDEAVGDEARATELVDRVASRFVRYVELVGRDESDEGADDEDEAAVADGDEGADDEDDEDASAEHDAGLRVTNDPTTLSFLLGAILAVEPVTRQELLEAPTAEVRLERLSALLDREILLLERGLEPWAPDRRARRVALN